MSVPLLSTLSVQRFIALVVIGICAVSPAQSEPLSPEALSEAALGRTTHSVRYDGSYFSIPYPNGDVPADIGVCTDVLIRSYRTLGIDLLFS